MLKITNSLACLINALGLVVAVDASAENDKVAELLEVTGTLSTTRSVFDKVPKVSVSREDIEFIRPASVVSLLRGIPGVNVTQQGGEGGLTFISLRGGEPNFTAVLIDGVKVSDPTNSRGGGFDFSGLDPLLVERLDVYFGGFSSVYGSDSLGGVISITTHDPKRATRKLTLEVASEDGYAAALKWSGELGGKVGYSLGAVDRRAGRAVPGDELERDQLNLRLQSVTKGEFQWSASWFRSSGDSSGFPEDSGGDRLAVVRTTEKRRFEQENASLAARWFISENWSSDLTVARALHEEQVDNPGIAPGVLQGVPAIVSASRYELTETSLVNTYDGDAFVVAVGGSVSREEGSFNSVLDFGFPLPADFDLNRDNSAYFGELSVDVAEHLSLELGLRRDDAEQLRETTRRLAVNYAMPAIGSRVSVRCGEGFKLPSFFALGHPLIGNSALKPELSENVSVNLDARLLDNRLDLALSYFYNTFDNLVDFDPVLFTSVNRSKVVTKGAELAAQFRPFSRLTLDGQVGYTDLQASGGVQLRRRPNWTGGAGIRWRIDDLTDLSVRGWYVGSFLDSSIATGLVTLAGYNRLDATVTRKLGKRFDLSFMVTNITDDDYREAVGFSNPGSQFRLALTANL